jgi:hypothetical protein
MEPEIYSAFILFHNGVEWDRARVAPGHYTISAAERTAKDWKETLESRGEESVEIRFSVGSVPIFKETKIIDWYDGPLVSIVEDSSGHPHLAVVHENDHPRSGWRGFVVVPLPEGATEARAVLRAATVAYMWDYGDDVVSYPTPLNVDEFLGGDVELIEWKPLA